MIVIASEAKQSREVMIDSRRRKVERIAFFQPQICACGNGTSFRAKFAGTGKAWFIEMEKKIIFSPPDIGQAEIDEVVSVLKSGWITTGPKTKEFESEIAKYCGTRRAASLNSATACMELTLRLLGIGAGDEVITSAYTYTASASVICHVGATPVLVDTAEGTFEMDYAQLEKAITPKTKAVIPVDIAGIMCDYPRILAIVNEKKALFIPVNDIQKAIGRVCVIADAAHSFGAVHENVVSGKAADFTSFSFHAIKNLTTAEGGAVTWNEIDGIQSDDIYRQFMLLSLHGQSKDALAKEAAGSWEYDILLPGYKCNMTDIMAALGLAQYRRYGELLSRRHQIIALYQQGLKDLAVQVFAHKQSSFASSGHLYMTRLVGRDSAFRNEIIKKMAEYGVPCNVHYKPLPLHTAYKKLGFDIKDFPNAYIMYQNELSLPLHTGLSDEDVAFIVHNLARALA